MARKTAKGEEAAAIAAAIAQFEAELSAPASTFVGVSPWQHAALLEGVGAKEIVRYAQGGTTWQS